MVTYGFRVALACVVVGLPATAWSQQTSTTLLTETRGGGGSDSTPAVVHGINRADLDTTCAACQDFYQFATGGWRAHNPIPAAFPRWGSFEVLQEHNRDDVRAVLDAAAASAKGGKPESSIDKVGVFYATCMDSTAADAQGLSPLAPELTRIASITTMDEVRQEAARLQKMLVGVAFDARSQQDAKDSREQILVVSQGGLGLPDRDYYLKSDSASVAARTAYVAHVARTLALAGDDSATARAAADRVMALETALAQSSRPRTERRDPLAIYHRMPLADAQALAPHLQWTAWLAAANVPSVSTVNVADPDFFRGLDTLLATTPVADWRAYLRWHYLNAGAPWLDSRFVAEDFSMQRVLTGSIEMLPRWKRCVRVSDQAMGEALGQAYVARAFPPAAKARALAMVRNMEAVLREDLGQLAWMSPATRAQAIAKLDAFRNKIGYPDKWRDYSTLTISRRPFVENASAASEFEYKRRIAKIGQPVDHAEWTMTPPTVNAYYSAALNEIVFPAGIMQPPFFDPKADDAVNYGSMGAVIGHEMTHGFDDQGRKYDAQGNLSRLVDGRRCHGLPAAGHPRRRSVRPLPGRGLDACERQAHAGRKHRGPGWTQGRAGGARALVEGQAATHHRWLHTGAALLPGLGPDLGGEHATRNDAATRADRSPRPGSLAGQRAVFQHAGIRGRLPLPGG